MGRAVIGLRHAARALTRSPGFAAAAIITLGLGIGACSAAYSLTRALLWRPLSIVEPDRLVVLHGANPARGVMDAEVSYADLRDLRDRVRTVSGFAAVAQRQAAVGSPEGAEHVVSWLAEPQFFTTLGVTARLGRTFRPDEGQPGAAPVAVITWPYFTRRFGRDPSIIGSTIPINDVPTTIVGVMGPDFQINRGDIWMPLIPDPSESRDERMFVAAGRLALGATIAAARAELEAESAALAAAYPGTNRGWGIELQDYRDDNVDAGTRRGLALMMAAVAMVLLIACANVAGLMLARGAGRARELAVRAAIGASRARLVGHALAECLVLAAAGGVLGLSIASWSNDLLLSALPAEDVPVWLNASMDWPTIAVTAAVTLGSVLLFGLLPALRASRPAVVETLKGGAGTRSSTRLRSALVVGQVGMAVVLLAATALFSQSFLATRHGNLGFDDRGVAAARVFFGAVPRDQRAGWMRDALARLRAAPGVAGAALTGALPGDDGGDHRAMAVDGQPVAPGDEPIVSLVSSSDDLTGALGITPVSGRWFTAGEAANPQAAVAVIGARMAKRFWPHGDAVGHRVRGLPDTTWLSIVGVIPDLQYQEFGEDREPDRLQLHVPYGREPWRSAVLMARSRTGDAASIVAPLRATAAAVRADVPVFDAMTMAEDRRYTTASDRSWLFIFGSLGVQALLMTAVGLYGLLAYGVAQRRREIGVRVALGARPASVVRMVVRRALILAAAGILIGLAGAAAVARVLESTLWGVSGTVAPVALAALTLLLTALAASLLPARRAARIDPMESLRAE